MFSNSRLFAKILATTILIMFFLPTFAVKAVQTEAIQIEIIYAPEAGSYLVTLIDQFNIDACQKGNIPGTSQKLPQPICISGISGSSGDIAEQLINNIDSPNPTITPTIFNPSVTHWLDLVNHRTGKNIFDFNENVITTANAAVVIAIWESRLNALKDVHGPNIGWTELLALMNNSSGWCAYPLSSSFSSSCRQVIYYGHTNPKISSTGLSTLIAEYYAGAFINGINISPLTSIEVSNPAIQQVVREIQDSVRHYAPRTTELKDYLPLGPDFLDFVALEENDLIAINNNQTPFTPYPNDKLVALYPKEGTFMHQHPMGILNAPWVDPNEQVAARIFIDFILSPIGQSEITNAGFRPADLIQPPGPLYTSRYGVEAKLPKLFMTPDASVIFAMQSNWSLVKRQAEVALVVDTSKSMDGGKIQRVQQAVTTLLASLDSTTNLGLITFDNVARVTVPIGAVSSVTSLVQNNIAINPNSTYTALFDAIKLALETINQPSSTPIRNSCPLKIIIVLSDGKDSGQGIGKTELLKLIDADQNSKCPSVIMPIAYGDPSVAVSNSNGVNLAVLTDVAYWSNTVLPSLDDNRINKVINPSNPDDLCKVMLILGGFTAPDQQTVC